MAKFTTSGMDDLIKQIQEAGNFDEIAEEMIEECMPILTAEVKKQAVAHKITGDMLASIKPMKKPLKNKIGWFMAVRPTGVDRFGERNAEKMAILEYGSSQQEASPVMSEAVAKSEDEIVAKMHEVLERKLMK